MNKLELVIKHIGDLTEKQAEGLYRILKIYDGVVTVAYKHMGMKKDTIRTIKRKLRIDEEGLYIKKDGMKAYVKMKFIENDEICRPIFSVDYYK